MVVLHKAFVEFTSDRCAYVRHALTQNAFFVNTYSVLYVRLVASVMAETGCLRV